MDGSKRDERIYELKEIIWRTENRDCAKALAIIIVEMMDRISELEARDAAD